VVLAALLGALIGIDRELADKPAGLRTHMLVASAAALLVGLSDTLARHFALSTDVDQIRAGMIRADPIRVIEVIITGVSFLGAGTIIRRERAGQVGGLTTAASILFSAGVGICVALLQRLLAAGVTVLALLILRGVKLIDRWMDRWRESDEHLG
jgi:putative Mg2+ transporter-C (MgtC) family protein